MSSLISDFMNGSSVSSVRPLLDGEDGLLLPLDKDDHSIHWHVYIIGGIFGLLALHASFCLFRHLLFHSPSSSDLPTSHAALGSLFLMAFCILRAFCHISSPGRGAAFSSGSGRGHLEIFLLTASWLLPFGGTCVLCRVFWWRFRPITSRWIFLSCYPSVLLLLLLALSSLLIVAVDHDGHLPSWVGVVHEVASVTCAFLWVGLGWTIQPGLSRASRNAQSRLLRTALTKMHIEGTKLPKRLPAPHLHRGVTALAMASIVFFLRLLLYAYGLLSPLHMQCHLAKTEDTAEGVFQSVAALFLELAFCTLMLFVHTWISEMDLHGRVHCLCPGKGPLVGWNPLGWLNCCQRALRSQHSSGVVTSNRMIGVYRSANMMGHQKFHGEGEGPLPFPEVWPLPAPMRTFQRLSPLHLLQPLGKPLLAQPQLFGREVSASLMASLRSITSRRSSCSSSWSIVCSKDKVAVATASHHGLKCSRKGQAEEEDEEGKEDPWLTNNKNNDRRKKRKKRKSGARGVQMVSRATQVSISPLRISPSLSSLSSMMAVDGVPEGGKEPCSCSKMDRKPPSGGGVWKAEASSTSCSSESASTNSFDVHYYYCGSPKLPMAVPHSQDDDKTRSSSVVQEQHHHPGNLTLHLVGVNIQTKKNDNNHLQDITPDSAVYLELNSPEDQQGALSMAGKPSLRPSRCPSGGHSLSSSPSPSRAPEGSLSMENIYEIPSMAHVRERREIRRGKRRKKRGRRDFQRAKSLSALTDQLVTSSSTSSCNGVSSSSDSLYGSSSDEEGVDEEDHHFRVRRLRGSRTDREPESYKECNTSQVIAILLDT